MLIQIHDQFKKIKAWMLYYNFIFVFVFVFLIFLIIEMEQIPLIANNFWNMAAIMIQLVSLDRKFYVDSKYI